MLAAMTVVEMEVGVDMEEGVLVYVGKDVVVTQRGAVILEVNPSELNLLY